MPSAGLKELPGDLKALPAGFSAERASAPDDVSLEACAAIH